MESWKLAIVVAVLTAVVIWNFSYTHS